MITTLAFPSKDHHPNGLRRMLALNACTANPYRVESAHGYFSCALIAALPTPSGSHGCVYAVEVGGLLKIGRSAVPKKRLQFIANEARNLGQSIGAAVVTIPHRYYGKLEIRIHHTFSEFRVRGEYFNLPLWVMADLFRRLPYEITQPEEISVEELAAHILRNYFRAQLERESQGELLS